MSTTPTPADGLAAPDTGGDSEAEVDAATAASAIPFNMSLRSIVVVPLRHKSR
jgi:hypothetical protein